MFARYFNHIRPDRLAQTAAIGGDVSVDATWVEEDDRSEAPQLRLVHLHVPHLGHQLGENSAQRERTTSDARLASDWLAGSAAAATARFSVSNRHRLGPTSGKVDSAAARLYLALGLFRKRGEKAAE